MGGLIAFFAALHTHADMVNSSLVMDSFFFSFIFFFSLFLDVFSFQFFASLDLRSVLGWRLALLHSGEIATGRNRRRVGQKSYVYDL